MSVSLPDLQACLVLKLKLTFKCFNNLWLFALLQQLLSHACQGTATVQMVQLKAASTPWFSPHIWHFSTISHPNSHLIFDISPQFVNLQSGTPSSWLWLRRSGRTSGQLMQGASPVQRGWREVRQHIKSNWDNFEQKNPTGERTFLNQRDGYLKLKPTFTFLVRDFAIFNTFTWENPYQEKWQLVLALHWVAGPFKKKVFHFHFL